MDELAINELLRFISPSKGHSTASRSFCFLNSVVLPGGPKPIPLEATGQSLRMLNDFGDPALAEFIWDAGEGLMFLDGALDLSGMTVSRWSVE